MLDTYRKLMDLLDARERRRFWLLFVLMTLMGLANMLGIASIMPFLAVLADPGLVERNASLSWAYGMSGAAEPMDFLIWLGVGAALAYLGALAFKAGADYAQLRFSNMRLHSFSHRMFDSYLARPYAWFLNRHSSDMARNVLNEVSLVVGRVLAPLLRTLSNAMLVLFLLGLLILVNPAIALGVAVLLGGGYALVFVFVRRRLSGLGGRRVAADRDRFQIAQEGLAGIKEVKVLGLEAGFSQRFDEPSRRVAEVSAANAMLSTLPRHLLEALAFLGMMTVVLILTVLQDGDLSQVLPVVGVYALAGSRLAPALQEVYRALAEVRFAKPGLDALHADLVSAPPLPKADRDSLPLHLRERLELKGVSYAYPGAECSALKGLSLEIAANTSVGLVGGTGAGKTTAVDVLMGLLEPQQGYLLVDGRLVETEDDRRAWRRSIGYVPQHIFLMDDTIAANIAFGVKGEDVDMAAVERAARMAQLHDFVAAELPEGYATRVGDRGLRLSGGQRQRIGIARALYHDPDVLVLDEATSALDNVTERAVMAAVEQLGGAKTILMIAHRLSTVMNCDEIFLLENGSVAARGRYNQLLERSSAFKEIALGVAV